MSTNGASMKPILKSIAVTGVRGLVACLFTGLVAGLGLSAPALAQERVDANKDWSVFVAGNGNAKVCWIVSQPTKSRAIRGGKDVKVNRGDIFLMVAVRPGDNVKNEVSFLSGYPFRGDSNVTVSVGSTDYTLFTDEENAWTRSPAEDDKLASAFRRGSTATIKGVSKRGTTTIDTFSLSGFTASLKSAAGRCK